MKRRSVMAAGAVAAMALSGCANLGAGAPWTPLFDGGSLDAFERVGDANWKVIDGVLEADRGTGFLVTKRSYRDFQIRA